MGRAVDDLGTGIHANNVIVNDRQHGSQFYRYQSDLRIEQPFIAGEHGFGFGERQRFGEFWRVR